MDAALKKRIMWFYIGGVINGVLGLYVLFQGHTFLEPGTARLLAIIFGLFAAVDFYMPGAIKKKWIADNAANHEQGDDGIRQR